jgi:multidrug efflux system membrane fusion protein
MNEQQLEIPLNYEESLDHSSHELTDDLGNERDSSKLRPKGLSKKRIGLAIAGLLLLGTIGFFSFRALTATKQVLWLRKRQYQFNYRRSEMFRLAQRLP